MYNCLDYFGVVKVIYHLCWEKINQKITYNMLLYENKNQQDAEETLSQE